MNASEKESNYRLQHKPAPSILVRSGGSQPEDLYAQQEETAINSKTKEGCCMREGDGVEIKYEQL